MSLFKMQEYRMWLALVPQSKYILCLCFYKYIFTWSGICLCPRCRSAECGWLWCHSRSIFCVFVSISLSLPGVVYVFVLGAGVRNVIGFGATV